MLLKPRRKPRWDATLPDFASAVAWSPDSTQLAVATLAGPVLVFDGAGGELLARHGGHEQGALAVAWSPDGARLASAGQDGRIELHERDGGSRALDGGGGWVEQLAWSPGGACLASAAGRVVRLWTADGELASEVTGYESTVTSLSWLPGKAELVTSCYGGLQFVEVGRAEWVRRLDWKGSILTAAPSPDGRFIATGNQDATVHVWVTRTGKDLQMNGYPRKVRELAWHGDGPLLATGGSDVITLWSFGGRGPAGKPPEELKGHEQRVCGLAFAGRRLVSVAEDGTLRVWERKQSWRCTRVETADMPLVGLGVSPDGRWAAAAGDGGQLAVWPLEDAGG